MSRSKKNTDHLVDYYGNYKQDVRDHMHSAFCSFSGASVDDFYADHNIASIVKDTPGHFIVTFKDPFPSSQFNVIVSCNSGFYRYHHAQPNSTNVELTIRDRNNNPVSDTFVTLYCFTSVVAI